VKLLVQQVFRQTTLSLPKFLVMALETMCRELNLERLKRGDGEPLMTLDEYVTWRLSEDITAEELVQLAEGVPGLRTAMRVYARWETQHLREIEDAKRVAAEKEPTRLARYMKAFHVSQRAVWQSGIISRRRLADLMNGAETSPTLRTMIDITREIRRVTGRPVEVADLFDLTVEE